MFAELSWWWVCWALIGWGTAVGLAVGVMKLARDVKRSGELVKDLRNLNRGLIARSNSIVEKLNELRRENNELKNRRVVILRASQMQPKFEMDRLRGMDAEKLNVYLKEKVKRQVLDAIAERITLDISETMEPLGACYRYDAEVKFPLGGV